MTDITSQLTAALADRYRIERRLGEGGMATVYLAGDLKHDRKVAVKVLRPELAAVLGADRFVQEIKTTASLQHPHILPLFDSGTATVPPLPAGERGTGGEGDGGGGGTFLYYVMPYIEGETLRDKLNRETQLGIEEAVAIASDVADALQYAHEHGVIHRDIKPENILLANGRPIVADFGIALAVSAAAGGRMTETGLSLGTPHYMSPEQATAERNITNRADIYSLAAVLYELLTGDPPHTGSSAQQVLMKIVTDPPRPVSEFRKSVPSNVAAATIKALEKLPADRFASAQEFAQALNDASFRLAASDAAPASTSQTTGTRARIVYAAGLALALAVGVWLGSTWSSDTAAPMARVSIMLDDGDDLGGSRSERSNADRPRLTNLAFAPDGRTIVFGGRRDGVRQLFRRSISDGETTPIPGTENAESPIFSPDGTELAFWSSNWLRRVPIAGGPAVQIAETPRFLGASWGDDDHIVFGTLDQGLKRVAAAGDGVVETLPADSAARLPVVLPGSKAVIYTVRYGTGLSERRIEALDRERGVHQTVIDNAADARYIATGHLLFARVGQLMAVPFDPGTQRTTGAPRGILPDVMQAMNGGTIAVTTDAAQYAASAAGHLAWLAGGITPSRLMTITALDRRGVSTPVASVPAKPWASWRRSPDGGRLALAAVSPSDGGLWVVDLERRVVVSLVDEPIPYATWSPDGSRLAFGSTDSLRIIAADGATPVERSLPVSGLPVAWSEAEDVVYLATRADGTLILRAVNVDTGQDRLVLEEPGPILYPALSPDRRWLAYTVDAGGQPQVVVRTWPSLEQRQIVSNGPGREPTWSRGGAELLYLTGEQVMMVDFRTGGPTVPQPLFSTSELSWAAPIRSWDVAADGMRFYGFRQHDSSDPPPPVIHVILNWFDELKER